ncbi:hypothetical protein WBP07_20105 (plasmid) [Novosphingobium sp. BL-8A]|uniref:hypothetical protein n=1 Tax=Novosphingobium sp. BL-8A TaxID=3127639 RepID=UPI003757CCD8
MESAVHADIQGKERSARDADLVMMPPFRPATTMIAAIPSFDPMPWPLVVRMVSVVPIVSLLVAMSIATRMGVIASMKDILIIFIATSGWEAVLHHTPLFRIGQRSVNGGPVSRSRNKSSQAIFVAEA